LKISPRKPKKTSGGEVPTLVTTPKLGMATAVEKEKKKKPPLALVKKKKVFHQVSVTTPKDR